MSTAGNAGQKPSPMLKAAPLWSKTSVKGGWYLTGRLGGVKVLILENRDRQTDDDPSHHLFFVEAPDRRQGTTVPAQERSDGQRAAGTPWTPQRPPQTPPARFQGHRVPDHQAPLDRDGPQPARDVTDDTPEWAR
jgi:hypothetical protein